jgi:YgiT-type zinc finger domain-containing protein
MSSSRQSSQSSRARKPGRCPTCGRYALKPVTEDVVLRVRRRAFRFESVPHERCTVCGERIFGIEASCKSDAVILPKRGRRVA